MDITRTREAFLDGQLLLIDKPLNWTSFQLVNKIRWAIRKTFDIKKIKVDEKVKFELTFRLFQLISLVM